MATWIGETVAGRFTVECAVGRGGMGAVYRARDERSGQPVALKLLHPASTDEALQRFTREAELLASLRHPGIVAHVAHGLTEQGHPFLAMEWLEGEDLARRLASQPLSLVQTLALVRRAAEALALAHQHGIVHRDLKPSNLFLRHGRPEDVVLLDFGLARHASGSLELTSSHAVLGTPGYMAPEQASSQGDIPPSADIFSLGCVLYECLTGQPPFAAPHFAAVLAKILFAEPTPLRSVRADLPTALQALVDRMLAKEPQARLPRAQALLEALGALEGVGDVQGPSMEPRPATLAGAEQQLVSVLLAAPPASEQPAAGPGTRVGLRDSLRAVLAPLGAQVELLADGSLVATLLPGRGAATDQAALAARCALSLKERWPEAWVVLTTGRGTLHAQRPTGEAMDRAGQLLQQLEQLPAEATRLPVLLDEVTAGLLGPSFQLTRPDSGTFLLHGEHLSVDASRPLLGRPTPCVGREQELSTLELAYTTCVEEPAAQALLVVAPAGTGKSRLRHEFLRRLERRGQQPLVLLGRGELLGAGSASGLLGQALRRLCGVGDTQPLPLRRQQLAARLMLHLAPEQAQEVVEFLGELCGVHFPDEHSPRLRAAREDPRLMGTRMARALVAFLQAECQRQPVLLVLEDLHWGDSLSVRLVDEALRELAEQPFMVLALARPEVKEFFPGLWARCLQELTLRGLSRKAAARLAQEVLGPQVPEPLIERLVEQAAGNALFLEELIRMVAEGRGEAPPETVLAMLQARLLRLEPGVRQVLLAASFLGRHFWSGAVQALLGAERSGLALEQALQQLVGLELVEPHSGSRFAGQAEYRFRHALVREAAYGLVPDSHRPMGHRLAALWLEQAGESEPRVLAEHYQLGQQPERAAHFFTLAAEQLFELCDLQGMARCVEAGLACGAQGEARGRLLALKGTAALWLGDLQWLQEQGRVALRELQPGNAYWCRLASALMVSEALGGKEIAELGRLLMGATPEPTALVTYLEALSYLCDMASWFGRREEARAIVARMEEVGSAEAERSVLVRSWIDYARSFVLYYLEARPWQAQLQVEQSALTFRDLGMERYATAGLVLLAMARGALGGGGGAVRLLREGLEMARQAEQPLLETHVRSHLALELAGSEEPAHQEEVVGLVSGWLESEHLNLLHRGTAHLALGMRALRQGELAGAEAEVRRACELLANFPPYLLLAHTELAAVLRAQGRLAEAREAARQGVRELERMGGEGTASVGMHLALAESCLAEGDTAAAEAALRQALRCVHARAADVPPGPERERFLHQVPENARTLALARQLSPERE